MLARHFKGTLYEIIFTGFIEAEEDFDSTGALLLETAIHTEESKCVNIYLKGGVLHFVSPDEELCSRHEILVYYREFGASHHGWLRPLPMFSDVVDDVGTRRFTVLFAPSLPLM